MAILDHTHIPSRDKSASARLFAQIFGLDYRETGGWCAGVRVNDSFSICFVDYIESFEMHHYAFLVDDEEFDQILERVQEAGISYGSDSMNTSNRELNSMNGGRGFYYLDLDGHLIELMTRPDRGPEA